MDLSKGQFRIQFQEAQRDQSFQQINQQVRQSSNATIQDSVLLEKSKSIQRKQQKDERPKVNQYFLQNMNQSSIEQQQILLYNRRNPYLIYRNIPRIEKVDCHPNLQRKKILDLFKNVQRSKIKQLRQELNYYVQQEIISQNNILNQMKTISQKIFANPSLKFKKYFGSYKQTLFKSVALRFGDIYDDVNAYQYKQIQSQIDQIMSNWISWGQFYFDLQYLQNCWKKGEKRNFKKQYQNPIFQLKVVIQGRKATVYYKNVEITPQQFQIKVLRKMAEKSLIQYLRDVYTIFLKQQYES